MTLQLNVQCDSCCRRRSTEDILQDSLAITRPEHVSQSDVCMPPLPRVPHIVPARGADTLLIHRNDSADKRTLESNYLMIYNGH